MVNKDDWSNFLFFFKCQNNAFFIFKSKYVFFLRYMNSAESTEALDHYEVYQSVSNGDWGQILIAWKVLSRHPKIPAP